MKMTAPRLVARASRSKFFIGIGLLILSMSFVAIFHTSQQQLDELRQLGLRCEQQQEAISAQMQVVVDQKLRLENSLASERMINEQNKLELQSKAKEEKELHNKSSMESNLRYASLQQHYKLLKSQHDDLNEECSKTKKEQTEEISTLQAKFAVLHTEVIRAAKQATDEVELLKKRNKKLQQDFEKMDKQIKEKDQLVRELQYKNYHLDKENDKYIEVCNVSPEELAKIRQKTPFLDEPPSPIPAAAKDDTGGKKRNFNEQIPMIPKPLVMNSDEANKNNGNNNNVLQEPTLLKTSTSISVDANKKTSEKSNNLQVPILAAPTVMPDDEQKKKSSTTTTATKKVANKPKSKTVPVGVVPIPENMNDFMKADENNSENGINNRYPNALQSSTNNKKDEGSNKKDLNFLNENGEQENGANEVHDNDFNIAHKENNLPNDNLNAAEEDTNLYDNNVNNKLFGNPGNKDYIDIPHHKNVNGNNAGKLMNEIAGDHGKEGDNYPNDLLDLHLDGQAEAEEEGDVGEYDDPKAMKQGHAERN